MIIRSGVLHNNIMFIIGLSATVVAVYNNKVLIAKRQRNITLSLLIKNVPTYRILYTHVYI